jgi:hypothetical protein
MAFNTELTKFQNRAYNLIMGITWLLYFTIAIGLSTNAPQYLGVLQSFTKMYISLFLIYRFNPFRRVKFTELDTKIAFGAGVFLLGTTAIDGILKYYLSNVTHLLTGK